MQHNAKVYLAARSKEKADKAIEELRKETGKEAIFLELDLANLKAIKRAAKTFMRYGSTVGCLLSKRVN